MISLLFYQENNWLVKLHSTSQCLTIYNLPGSKYIFFGQSDTRNDFNFKDSAFLLKYQQQEKN